MLINTQHNIRYKTCRIPCVFETVRPAPGISTRGIITMPAIGNYTAIVVRKLKKHTAYEKTHNDYYNCSFYIKLFMNGQTSKTDTEEQIKKHQEDSKQNRESVSDSDAIALKWKLKPDETIGYKTAMEQVQSSDFEIDFGIDKNMPMEEFKEIFDDLKKEFEKLHSLQQCNGMTEGILRQNCLLKASMTKKLNQLTLRISIQRA
jgi:hypothetical protein